MCLGMMAGVLVGAFEYDGGLGICRDVCEATCERFEVECKARYGGPVSTLVICLNKSRC